jgi:NitT/TauT family transport system substrate-binding protein
MRDAATGFINRAYRRTNFRAASLPYRPVRSNKIALTSEPNRKGTTMRLGCAAFIAITLSAGLPGAAIAKDKLTVATYLEPAHLSAFWPLMNGKIASDTLEVEIKNLAIGAAGQAMATKQFDVFEVGALNLEDAAAQGLDIKMVGTALRYKLAPAGFGIWVKADAPYNTIADLKGKTIGSYGFKTTVFAIQRMALSGRYHVDVALDGGDFKFVQLPAPNLPGALSTDRIDAATLSHLQSYQARTGKDFRILVDSGKDMKEVYGIPMVTSIFVAYPERLAEKPEAHRELLRMLKASSDYTLAHQDEVFTAVAGSTKVPKEFFVDWWANYGSFPTAISQGDIKAIETIYAKAKEFGMSTKPPDLKQAIWDQALRE